MKKKIILISSICIILFISLIIVITSFPITFFGKLEKMQEKKEDFLIYVTDQFENCAVCIDVNYMINFYKKNYNVDFLEFNIGISTKSDYQKFLSEVGYTSSIELTAPAIIYMKNGELKTIMNNIVDENSFRNVLIENKFIDKKYKNTDTLMSKKEYDNLYKSSEKTLIAIYNYEEETYLIRERLLELNKKYKFNFRIVYAGVSESGLISMELMEKLGFNNFKVPSLIIVQNSQIIDQLNSTDTDKIIKFLKKNQIIT